MAQSSKSRRKELKSIPVKAIQTEPSSITNVSQSRSLDVTISPYDVGQSAVEDFKWNRLGTQTHVPEIGKEQSNDVRDASVTKSLYAESWPGLIDKYIGQHILFSKRNIIVLCVGAWAVYLCMLFYQESGRGKLDNLQGLQWFGTKCIYVTVFLFIAIIIIWVFLQTTKGSKTKK